MTDDHPSQTTASETHSGRFSFDFPRKNRFRDIRPVVSTEFDDYFLIPLKLLRSGVVYSRTF